MHFLDHIWTFVTDVVNVYIYSIILQILMNMVVHVEAFKSGLVSRERFASSIAMRVTQASHALQSRHFYHAHYCAKWA